MWGCTCISFCLHAISFANRHLETNIFYNVLVRNETAKENDAHHLGPFIFGKLSQYTVVYNFFELLLLFLYFLILFQPFSPIIFMQNIILLCCKSLTVRLLLHVCECMYVYMTWFACHLCPLVKNLMVALTGDGATIKRCSRSRLSFTFSSL